MALERRAALGPAQRDLIVARKESACTIMIGNAPCSWGVEFPDDPRNPPWTRVLDECREARLSRASSSDRSDICPKIRPSSGRARRARSDLDRGSRVSALPRSGSKWDDVKDAALAHLPCADGAQARASRPDRFNLAPPRPDGRTRLTKPNRWRRGTERLRRALRDAARMGAEDYGLTVSIHAARGRLRRFRGRGRAPCWTQSTPKLLKICLDTGHCALCRLRSRGLLRSPYRSGRLCPLQGHRPEGTAPGSSPSALGSTTPARRASSATSATA